MEFYAYAFASQPSSSSATTVSAFLETCRQLTVKAIVGNVISAIVALFSGIAGALFGAINGVIICQQSDSSYFRGAVVGAVSGALSSIEVFESFLRLWSSDGKGFQCLLYLGDVLISLVNGKLVRERVGPILINPRRPSQMTTVTETSFEDIFEKNKCKGLSVDIVHLIPTVEITSENRADSCSVCLEDFRVGEDARTLPHCNHMFHASCIDQWLIKCGSCPLCRRNLSFYPDNPFYPSLT